MQPFLHGTLSFIHNGAYHIDTEGTESDSHAVFRRALEESGRSFSPGCSAIPGTATAGAGDLAALEESAAKARVEGRTGYTGAVTVSTDGTRVTAARHYNASHPSATSWGFDDYYTLRMYTGDGVRLAASQALPSLEALEDLTAHDLAPGETAVLA